MARKKESSLGNGLAKVEDEYDFQKIEAIIKSLDFLRREAISTQDKRLTSLITSCFNMCFICYDLASSVSDKNHQDQEA